MIDQTTQEPLQEITGILESEQYEQGGYFTIGGGAGLYVCKSPWNTECEVKIACITTDSAQAGYTISTSNNTIVPPVAGTTAFGAYTNGGEMNNQFPGIAGFCGNGAPIIFTDWHPLGRGVYVYAYVNPASTHTMLVTLAFRRLLLKTIPNAPRMRPSTHTRPASRRPLRMLGALSKQYSGFDTQYAGGAHGEFDHEPIPESQDLKSTVVPSHTSRNSGRGR